MEEVKVAGYKGKREKCVQDKENAEIEYQLLSKNKSISTVKKVKSITQHTHSQICEHRKDTN